MAQLSSQLTARKLAEACLTELIWKTANIEIDGISRETVESVLNGVRPPVCPPRTVTTVINIDRAFHELFAYCDEPVSWALISHYNEILRAELDHDAGHMRNYPVAMSGTNWKPELPTYPQVRKQIDSALAAQSAPERAITLFAQICRGQWFGDGNKRTALLVANHELIHSGYAIMSIEPEKKSEFLTLLLAYYESNNRSELAQWLEDNCLTTRTGQPCPQTTAKRGYLRE